MSYAGCAEFEWDWTIAAGGWAALTGKCDALSLSRAFHAAAGVADVTATGSRATTTVPLPFEWMSRLPPSCRSLSRMPRIPTPGVPVEASSNCFSGGMPLPRSSTSTET